MLGTISYRGPDEKGYVLVHDNQSGLAHAFGNVRLSIVDLAHGHQPMISLDGRYLLTFNGEIYNYIELRRELEQAGANISTQSDTEILLYALIIWGKDALTKLDGQFAFSLYDKQENSMLLARDPAGERPLFYTRNNQGIFFASEIKAIYNANDIHREIDQASLIRSATTWTSLPTETIYKNIQSIAPGQYIEFKNETVSSGFYFTFTNHKTESNNPIKAVKEALQISVRRRLRADVPVGVYLSGGLDSSITTFLATQESSHTLRSYSITFEDEGYDETHYQQELASHLGTDHTAIHIKRYDIAQNFPEALYHTETAQFRTAFVPLFNLAKQVRKDGIRVVLTGEGADEIFLGYNIFKETLIRSHWDSFANDNDRAAALSALYPHLKQFSNAQVKQTLSFYNSTNSTEYPVLFSHLPRFTNGKFAARLFNNPSNTDVLTSTEEWINNRYPNLNCASPIEKAQTLEWNTLLNGYLLSSQADRMTAAASIEGRCPFLSPDVIAIANGLPQDLKLHNGIDEKYILKQAFKNDLPPSVINRPKQPYRAPDAICFLEKNRPEWVEETLSEKNIQNSDIVNTKICLPFIKNIFTKDPDKISARENAAFILLLSSLELERQFIRGESLKKAEAGGDFRVLEEITR